MLRTALDKINQLGAKIILGLLAVYRYFISPVLGNNCRFYPSCSEYAQIAIRTHGMWCGSWLVIKRLSKCHPWHDGGEDPVPPKRII